MTRDRADIADAQDQAKRRRVQEMQEQWATVEQETQWLDWQTKGDAA